MPSPSSKTPDPARDLRCPSCGHFKLIYVPSHGLRLVIPCRCGVAIILTGKAIRVESRIGIDIREVLVL